MFQVLIVGASVGGLATALTLHQRQVTCFQVIETAAASTTATASRAVGLWSNAWQVLDALGIGNQVRRASPWSASEFWVHDLHTNDISARTCLRCFSLPKGHEFRRVPMKAFLEALVASIPTERIWYETSLDKWLQQREERQRALSEHAAHAMMNPLFTVGADGARSVVRHRLLGDRQPLRPAGYVAHTGITNVPVVQAPRPDDLMTTTTLQELTAPGRVLLLLGRGDGTRLGVHRIDEQTVFWFFCENVQPPREFQATGSLSLQRGNETKTRVWTELSRRLRTPQGPLWNALEQLIRHTPASAASTVHCADLFPPTLDGLSLLDSGPVALVGDAAHPMTPNLSQGAGLALEDAWTLANLLADEWTNCSLPMVENIERLGQRIRQKYRRQRYWRTGLLSLRSRLTGAALQQQVPLPALVTLRNRVLLPLALQPQLFVSHARSKPLSLP